jgi:hypothetical protein
VAQLSRREERFLPVPDLAARLAYSAANPLTPPSTAGDLCPTCHSTAAVRTFAAGAERIIEAACTGGHSAFLRREPRRDPRRLSEVHP